MLDLIKLPKAQIEKGWVIFPNSSHRGELLQKNLNLSSQFVFHSSTCGSGSN